VTMQNAQVSMGGEGRGGRRQCMMMTVMNDDDGE